MRLPERLRWGRLLAVPLVVGLVMAEPRPAQAQEPSDAPSVEELRREIEQLRRRIEILERQATATAADPPEPPPPAGAEPTLPEAPPLAEGEDRNEVGAPVAPPAAEIGAIETTEEEVERALERALVQTGALLLPAGAIEIEPSFSYSRQEALIFLGEDGGQFLTADEVHSDSLETNLTLRLGLPFDSQLEVDVPYRYENLSTVTRLGSVAPREESTSISGFGDLAITFTKALLRERGWRPNLFGSVRWDTDTGETESGIPLGSGFHEISGSLTASKRQDPLVFVGSMSYTTSFREGGVAPGDEVGFSVGAVLAASPETSLRFFLSQSFVEEVEIDGRGIPGSDQVVGTFVVGASSILSTRMLLDVTAGIGLTEDASDYFVSVSLPIALDLPFR